MSSGSFRLIVVDSPFLRCFNPDLLLASALPLFGLSSTAAGESKDWAGSAMTCLGPQEERQNDRKKQINKERTKERNVAQTLILIIEARTSQSPILDSL